jgi:hypothetical protein
MKYELSKEEFETIHTTLLKMVELACGVMKHSSDQRHEIALRRLDLETRRQEFEEAKVGIMRVRHADSLEEEDEPSSSPTLVFSKSDEEPRDKEEQEGFTTFPENDLSEHQARGKIYLTELLTFWLRGFRDENAEQPDRNEYLEELARDGHRSGAIVSYSMSLGGLTRAVWNALYHLVHIHEEDLQEHLTYEGVRYIAGHITQVSSIHLAPLADEFEYPNPFLQMEE